MSAMEADLHILNGDFSLDLWRQKEFKGQSLVWREIYPEGPLPDTEDLEDFRRERAEFLSSFAELSSIDRERLLLHLEEMDNRILNLPDNSTLQLWFDACIFDQTLLMRILSLLALSGNASVRVFLYCCEGNCLSSNDFDLGMTNSVTLLPADWTLGKKSWESFLRKDPAHMLQLVHEENFERLPKMQKALLRCAEEVPDSQGLTRTDRQILELVANGKRTFKDIFTGLDGYEEYPFLGDTSCLRLLDALTTRNFLTRDADGNYHLLSLKSSM